MKPFAHPIAIAALLLVSATSMPASAAMHMAQADMPQHRSIHPRTTNTNQRPPSRYRDGYNAQASAPSTSDSRAAPARNEMPAGWRCVQRGLGDMSAYPNWEICD